MEGFELRTSSEPWFKINLPALSRVNYRENKPSFLFILALSNCVGFLKKYNFY